MKIILFLAALLLPAAASARMQAGEARTQGPGNAKTPVVVRVRAVRDSVIAHQTAWIEVRITNNGSKPLLIPYRSDKIPAEWLFIAGTDDTLMGWGNPKEMEKAPRLEIGPGETLYEVLSPESCFGVLTNPQTVKAFCRAGGTVSDAAIVTRRPLGPGDRASALRSAGPLNRPEARDETRMRLWSLCAKGNPDYFDCDEALFTVAWDRLQVAPMEAQAIVDTLVARNPNSGWCRPALLELAMRLPDTAARHYLEGLIEKRPGGVAEAYAAELLRRALHRQFPVPGD